MRKYKKFLPIAIILILLFYFRNVIFSFFGAVSKPVSNYLEEAVIKPLEIANDKIIANSMKFQAVLLSKGQKLSNELTYSFYKEISESIHHEFNKTNSNETNVVNYLNRLLNPYMCADLSMVYKKVTERNLKEDLNEIFGIIDFWDTKDLKDFIKTFYGI